MSFQAKRELLGQVAPRYREASGVQKHHILDEFVAATGYARKYAIRVLGQPIIAVASSITRPSTPAHGHPARPTTPQRGPTVRASGSGHLAVCLPTRPCPATPDQGVYPLNPVSAAAITCPGAACPTLVCPDTWSSSPTVMARFG